MTGRLLLIGYFVLLVALVAAGLFAVSVLLSPDWAVIVAILLLLALFVRFVLARRAKVEPSSAWISRNRHPELWRVVDELAATADTRSPDEIRLSPFVQVAVDEDTSLFGKGPGFRRVTIGLPLLAGLSVSELRAVVSHELGHFSADHIKFSVLEYRAKTLVGRIAQRRMGVVKLVMLPYALLYAQVTKAANHARELAADAVAVQAAGKDATISALGKLAALDAIWERFKRAYVREVPYHQRQHDLLPKFNGYLASAAGVEQVSALRTKAVENGSTSWFDPHPPATVRLAALDAMASVDEDSAPESSDETAWVLLTAPEPTLRELERQLFDDL
jgi:Zn-dependent protease with chaperone function